MRFVGRWAPAGVIMLFSLFAAQDVAAWGDTGHQIICEIAFQELNSQARAQVIQLLRQDPDFMLFSKACTWPDHPRTRAREHFVNLPRAAAQIGDDPCPLDDICVVTAIDKDFAVLSHADTPEMDRLAALKYLGHWVGDVHQPLHVSFQDDRGGNCRGARTSSVLPENGADCCARLMRIRRGAYLRTVASYLRTSCPT